MGWRLLQGDVFDKLRDLPSDSVQCVVTSPPYWGLRDYGVDGQLGLERTPDEHVENLVVLFRDVRRVLRDDGTLWLNYGDSFQKKQLVGMPWRIAFALQADGWYLRSDIIWAKPNPMPESVTDRPTKAHEYLFLLTKSPRYFYDQDATREEMTAWKLINGEMVNTKGGQGFSAIRYHDGQHVVPNPAGRNLRTVWTIATESFSEAHFATFPKKLVEPCILAGTSERGCCEKCGAPWRRIVEVTGGSIGKGWHDHTNDSVTGQSKAIVAGDYQRATKGWQPSCECAGLVMACTVLDPFCGSGTVGVVALRHGRSFVGIELNEKYIKIAERRIVNDAPLFNYQAGGEW